MSWRKIAKDCRQARRFALRRSLRSGRHLLGQPGLEPLENLAFEPHLEPEKRPASSDPSFAAAWCETGDEEGIIQRTVRRWRGHGK